MYRSQRRFTRSVTIGTAAALGLSGLFIAPAAFAAPAASTAVTGTDYAVKAQALLSDDAIQAVGKNADGTVVVLTTGGDSAALDEFSTSYPDLVVHEVDSEIETNATNDVVGGAGYYVNVSATTGGSCSIGFTGWSPEGDPAIITAGHCVPDGTTPDTDLTVPAGDAAGEPALLAPLGTFGFGQYGGVGGSDGAVGDLDSIDIAVMDVTNDALNLEPAVTDWSNTADLSASTTPITAVGTVDATRDIAKSGRTSGLSEAPAADIFIEAGWAKVSGREVYGFGVWDLQSEPGDSGGAIFQGTTAVGVISGSADATGTNRAYAWGSDLVNGLAHTDGYTVAVELAAPVLTSPTNGGTVERGAAITGTGPASTTIVVDPATGDSFEVTTNAQGVFTFTAPAPLGAYAFTLQSKSGFSLSPTSAYSLVVVPAPLLAPAIVSPANGSSSTADITAITGTAVPGAVITLTGDVTGTAVTSAAGAWSIDADLSYGIGYSVSAIQALEGLVSPAAISTFNVVPTAAVIETPANGAEFANSAAPTTASGTGIDGATITLIQNGGTALTTTVVDGRWSFALSASKVGANTLVVTQTIDGVATVAESGYTLAAAAVAAVPRDPSLAATGVDLMPAGGLAAVLLLAGAAFLAIRKKRIGTVQN